ncbi:hypothetical protein [Pseudoalteromonas sp. H103]|uniref:hypothetical protein n=1 Tax=Pseudoalteromonas sp. H103 TaxID=1761893 RepID=UPI0007323C6A|nr:hypothetical protein [Pseudoalteromonas sp. H103]KTF09128.1 hypothetical protein ATS74_14375 [Pseudoalteromonas sp. H103]
MLNSLKLSFKIMTVPLTVIQEKIVSAFYFVACFLVAKLFMVIYTVKSYPFDYDNLLNTFSITRVLGLDLNRLGATNA